VEGTKERELPRPKKTAPFGGELRTRAESSSGTKKKKKWGNYMTPRNQLRCEGNGFLCRGGWGAS